MELYIPKERPQRNAVNGRYLKGVKPHNKGRKWSEWMSEEAQQRVRERLKFIGRPRMDIGGWNKKSVIMIDKDGKEYYFESSVAAEKVTGVPCRNIRYCCNGERKTSGGYKWHYFDNYKRE